MTRLIVPATFVTALLVVLAFTVSWVPHPQPVLHLEVDMGPPGIVPGRYYGLRFTPRNPATRHILTVLAPSQRRCVDVTITDSSLTYLDERKACRFKSGSYGLVYRFPRPDDYVIFAEMHPKGSAETVGRNALPLDLCALHRDDPTWHGTCARRVALLRGQEIVRSHTVDGLTIVLGAPAHAVEAGQTVHLSFVVFRQGRSALDLQPVEGAAGRAFAISADTQSFVRLQPDAGQLTNGYVKAGAVSFTGLFNRPSIYRVFATFRRRSQPVRTSFVIDVNPQPTPTPQSND